MNEIHTLLDIILTIIAIILFIIGRLLGKKAERTDFILLLSALKRTSENVSNPMIKTVLEEIIWYLEHRIVDPSSLKEDLESKVKQ